MPFSVGSLFAGIGGFDLGLERAGMTIKWQVEIEPFCLKVLQKHWPYVPKYGDIRQLRSDGLGTVDLICGGFPCQPFSAAGKRRGKDDDRYLWPEMCRLISEIRPHWVIGENVTGIVNMELDKVLFDLENQGYETQAFIIPACGVNAPHRRDRVWIIAYSSCQRRRRLSQNKQNRRTGWDLEIRKLTDTSCKKTDTLLRLVRNLPKPRSGLLRNDDGLSEGMDRLKSLGNAVVPQIVEILGRAIMEIEKNE